MADVEIRLNESASKDFLELMELGPAMVEDVVNISLERIGQEMRNDAAEMAPYKTGTLKRSITSKRRGSSGVAVGTDLKYARIHDQGGNIGPIVPKKAKALRFKINGKVVFAKKVKGRHIKPYKGRGYLTPAYKKMVDGRAAEIVDQEFQHIFKR